MKTQNISRRLAMLTAEARELGRRSEKPRSRDVEDAETRRILELCEHLPMEMIEAAGRGLTSVSIMHIEPRHYDSEFHRAMDPKFIGNPRLKEAFVDLKGAARAALQWIREHGLTPDIDFCLELVEGGDVRQEYILVARWLDHVADNKSVKAA